MTKRRASFLFLLLALLILSSCSGKKASPSASDSPSKHSPKDSKPNSLTIHPVLDEEHGVKATIDSKGGTLETTDDNGIQYELIIPADAVNKPETISLLPVQSIEDLPMSGGLKAAVHLQPEGLFFNKEVELKITMPEKITTKHALTGFSYHKEGEETHLYPIQTSGDNQLKLTLFHFSGYGGGDASSSDAKKIAEYTPSSPKDAVYNSLLTDDENMSNSRKFYQKYVRSALKAAIANPDTFSSAFQLYLQWMRTIELLGYGDSFETEYKESWELVREALEAARELAQTRCYEKKDPSQVNKLLEIERASVLLGFTEDSDNDLASILGGCLRFEVDSMIHIERDDHNTFYFNYDVEGHGLLDQLLFDNGFKLAGELDYKFNQHQYEAYVEDNLVTWSMQSIVTSRLPHRLWYILPEGNEPLQVWFESEDLPTETAISNKRAGSKAGIFKGFFHFFFNPYVKNSNPNYNWKLLTEFNPGEPGSDLFAVFDKTFTANFSSQGHPGTMHWRVEVRHAPLPADQY